MGRRQRVRRRAGNTKRRGAFEKFSFFFVRDAERARSWTSRRNLERPAFRPSGRVPRRSVSLMHHAVGLAANLTDLDERGVEWRRVYAGKLAVMMYYADRPEMAAELLASLVVDLDFSDVAMIQSEAERVIWLGAAQMRSGDGQILADEDYEMLKAAAVEHLSDKTMKWDAGNTCLRAAFQLFMVNDAKARIRRAETSPRLSSRGPVQRDNTRRSYGRRSRPQAMRDLDACLDSKNDEDRFLANHYLSIYADARYKVALSRSYGNQAFRLIQNPPTSYRMIVAAAHTRYRAAAGVYDCPCLDDRFFEDIEGGDCKSHEGYDCTAYVCRVSDQNRGDAAARGRG